MTNGVTTIQGGNTLPNGSVVHTVNGDYMRLNGVGVKVTATTVILPNGGGITTGYNAEGTTYMLGGKRPSEGSVVQTSGGNYLMYNGSGLLLSTVSMGSSSNSSEAVKALQRQLNALGYTDSKGNSLIVDGNYGAKTQEAINSFNGKAGNNAVNAETWNKLYLAKPIVKSPSASETAKPTNIVGKESSPTLPDNIKVASGIEYSMVDQGNIDILSKVVGNAELTSVTISSTMRTAEGQARAMYGNLYVDPKIKNYKDEQDKIIKEQIRLYSDYADAVVRVYEKMVYDKTRKYTKDEIIAAMTAEIEKQGLTNVSKHCMELEDYQKQNTIDIGKNSIKDKAAFEDALDQAKIDGYIVSYLDEDRCIHIVFNKK